MAPIPPASLVLVTGANSFLASRIVDQLLVQGYRVRGTVRDDAKRSWLADHFGSKYGHDRVDFVLVPAMSASRAFADAVKGASGVVHVAANLSFSVDPNTVVPDTVKGTVEALEAASAEPSVQRFVYCSSSAAAAWPNSEREVEVDESTFNTQAVDDAWNSTTKYEDPNPARGMVVYGASKTQAEQAMWAFVKEKKPHFVCNSVLPSTILGPCLSPDQPNLSTAGFICGIYTRGLQDVRWLPPQYFIDVRDAARLHVAGLTDPDIQQERIYGFVEKYTWNDILRILRKASPNHKFPDDEHGFVYDKMKVMCWDRSVQILKKNYHVDGFITLEDSVKANVAHMKA